MFPELSGPFVVVQIGPEDRFEVCSLHEIDCGDTVLTNPNWDWDYLIEVKKAVEVACLYRGLAFIRPLVRLLI
jgi:hypothetical protein